MTPDLRALIADIRECVALLVALGINGIPNRLNDVADGVEAALASRGDGGPKEIKQPTEGEAHALSLMLRNGHEPPPEFREWLIAWASGWGTTGGDGGPQQKDEVIPEVWGCNACGVQAPWPSPSGMHGSRCRGDVVELITRNYQCG